MLSTSEMLLAYARFGLLLSTILYLALRRTQRLTSFFLPVVTANHYWVAISLFGCSVVGDFSHALVLTGGGSLGWLLPFITILLWTVRARWYLVWLILWSTGFGLELLILFHIMVTGTRNTFERSAYGNFELWSSFLRQLLFVFIGMQLFHIWHVAHRGEISQQFTPLLGADLEANYNTVSQSLPRRQKESWSNRVLCFLVHIWPNTFGLRLLFFSTILLLFLQPAVNLLLPYFLSNFLERNFHLGREQNIDDFTVLQALCTYLVFRVLGKTLDLLPKSLWNRVMQSGIRSGTNTAFGNFLSKDEDWNTRYSTSEKLLAIGKFRAVIKFTTEVLFGILPTIIDLLLAAGFTANRFGLKCAVEVTLAGLFLICFLLWSSRRTARLEKVRSDAKARIEKLRGDLIGSYQDIQSLQKEERATADHDVVVCDGQEPENDLIDWTSKSDMIQEVIFSLGVYFLIQKALAGIAGDSIKPVDISALLALAIQLQKRLGTLGDSFHRTLKYWISGCRVLDLLEETPTTFDLADAVDLYPCHGNVEFQNVEFAYSDQPVLKNISFTCHPGKTIVFVGKSGAGKSTIRKLLFRNYLAQNGCIRIDGHDIRKLTKCSLRRYIGAVSQKPTLLNRTLLENLRFANERAGDEDIKKMCRKLGFHATFNKLGYNTNVGNLGSHLSGGQIMMVAIARIMIRGCKIAIFDEATGPFDHMTGEIFEQAIDKMKVSMTVVFIAHRKSTVERADWVFFLRDGYLCDAGTHDELTAENQDYASFWTGDSQHI